MNLSKVLSGERVSKDCSYRFIRGSCLRHARRLRMSKERYRVISEHLFPSSAEDVLARWTAKYQHYQLRERCAAANLLELRRLFSQQALDALRILANTPPTTHRLHASNGISPCVFCFCSSGDHLSHLIQCPALVSEITRFFKTDSWPTDSVARCAFLGRLIMEARHSGAPVRQLIRAVWHPLPSRLKAAIACVARP